MTDRIYNADGLVAVKFYQTIPHVIGISGVQYAFVVQHNYCLGWIAPEHVEKILSMKRHCCGNNTKRVYFLATQYHVDIWEGNIGR